MLWILKDIKKVQVECYRLTDEKSWLIALIADSGIRLAEGAGLLKSDFSDQEGTLCVHINPHPWRSLKTPSIKRLIPLVGSAKWAAEQILDQTSENTFAFATYNYKQRTNANSASASLNKWLKGRIGQPFSIHSFRHSMRDRFREVNCPQVRLLNR